MYLRFLHKKVKVDSQEVLTIFRLASELADATALFHLAPLASGLPKKWI